MRTARQPILCRKIRGLKFRGPDCIISIIENDFPCSAFKLYLSLVNQINSVKNSTESFAEYAYNSLTSSIQLFNKGKINENYQVDLIHQIVNVLLNLNILSKEDLLAIATNVIQASQTILKKGDQCLAILSCSHLFYNTIHNMVHF